MTTGVAKASAINAAPISKLGLSEVRFGIKVVDLARQLDPISHESFQTLMDEEESYKPYFLFACVHSRSDEKEYQHLYSAQNIVQWYPLEGRTDPCTCAEIGKIEYYLYMKGDQSAIHVGDVYRGLNIMPVSKSADYLIWSLTAEDEPSKMMSLMAIAFLQHLGFDSVTTDDTFDSSDVLRLSPLSENNPRQRKIKHQQLNGRKILRYVRIHTSKLVEKGEIICSDHEMLLVSLAKDASTHIADFFVSQDPNANEGSDDYARLPHIRINALATAIMKSCVFYDPRILVSSAEGSASGGKEKIKHAADGCAKVRRQSI